MNREEDAAIARLDLSAGLAAWRDVLVEMISKLDPTERRILRRRFETDPDEAKRRVVLEILEAGEEKV
jgi:hypothetical protein